MHYEIHGAGEPLILVHGGLGSTGMFGDVLPALADPHGLFNAGLDAKATRAIDLHEGDVIDVPAIQELVRATVALNAGGKKN